MKKKIKMILTAIIFAVGFFIGFFGGGVALATLQNVVCEIQENGNYKNDFDYSRVDCEKCKNNDCLFN
jgi:hypothetical protein